MQALPFAVVSNRHISNVYDLYICAFETFRKIEEIRSVQDNDTYCKVIASTLKEHLTVIPSLAMGMLECRDLMPAEYTDSFMNTILKSRISRRVIAEQHLALTEAFSSQRSLVESDDSFGPSNDFLSEVLLRCHSRDVLEYCEAITKQVAKQAYAPDEQIPEIRMIGDLGSRFSYVHSHLEYIIGELLRNSMQAVVERYRGRSEAPPPIEVLVVENPQHVIFRISDQGGGVPEDVLSDIWSFSKGPRQKSRLQNLSHVPKMAATLQDLESIETRPGNPDEAAPIQSSQKRKSSLGSLTSRPPNLRLGIGLPMSRAYAQYWAGSLELHSLAGYGADAFLQIPKLGNKNEQMTTRATMDAV